MNKYLLLRNNKQSGPHSYNELMEIGIKSYDLLWIEGKSASWRYPAEFDEFKTHLAVIKELPVDRSFTAVQNDILFYRPESKFIQQELPEDELSEFPTLARFIEPRSDNDPDFFRQKNVSKEILPNLTGIADKPGIEIKSEFEEKANTRLYSSQLNQTVERKSSEVPVPSDQITGTFKEAGHPVSKRVSVTLPDSSSNKTFVVIQRRDISKPQIPIEEKLPKPEQKAERKTPVIIWENFDTAIPPLQEEIQSTKPAAKRQVVDFIRINEANEHPAKAELVVTHPGTKEVKSIEAIQLTAEEKIPSFSPELPKVQEKKEENRQSFPVISTSKSSANLLQKLAVAAGIISLIAVAGLIFNSILNPEAYNYPVDQKNVNTVNTPDQGHPGRSPADQQEFSENQNLNTSVGLPATELPAEQSKVQTKNEAQNKKDKKNIKAASGVASTDQANASLTTEQNLVQEEKKPEPDPREEIRRNINNLVSYQYENLKINTFGGVSNFDLSVYNSSSYPLDLVVVELKYIQSNKKVFKTERLEFKGITPGGKQTIGVPKSNRGIKVETSITTISSRELDLGYNHQ